MSNSNRLLIASITLTFAVAPGLVSAQQPEVTEPPAAEVTTTTTTTTTETEVVTPCPELPPAPAPAPTGPAAAAALTDRASDTAPTEDVLTGSVSAGGVLNTGNSSSATFSSGGTFRWVHLRNAFEAESTVNVGAADATPDDGDRNYDLNTRNWNSRARYDRFFTDNDAAYFSTRHRWDSFAGLDVRLQFQIGYLRNFYKVENHRIWGEVGYDFTWDNVHNATNDRTATHAARAFLGYQNHLNEHVEFLVNVESLFNFEEGRDVRINGDTTLRATVSARLALEVQFKMQFDNVPVVVTPASPGVPEVSKEPLDTQTTVRLVYTLF